MLRFSPLPQAGSGCSDSGDGFAPPYVPGGQQSWDGSRLSCSSSDAQGRPQIINTESSSTAPSCPSLDSNEQKQCRNSEGRRENACFLPSSLPPSISFQLSSAKATAALALCRTLCPGPPRAPSRPGSGFGRASGARALRDGRGTRAHLPERCETHPPQAKREAGRVHPRRSVIKSRPLSEHKPGTCWHRPRAPPEPTLSLPRAGGSALGGGCCITRCPLAKSCLILCRRGRAGLPCLSAIGGLPGAYQFIRGQKTLSRRVLRQCERLIRNSPGFLDTPRLAHHRLRDRVTK